MELNLSKLSEIQYILKEIEKTGKELFILNLSIQNINYLNDIDNCIKLSEKISNHIKKIKKTIKGIKNDINK